MSLKSTTSTTAPTYSNAKLWCLLSSCYVREEWYYRLNILKSKKYNNIKFGAYTTKWNALTWKHKPPHYTHKIKMVNVTGVLKSPVPNNNRAKAEEPMSWRQWVDNSGYDFQHPMSFTNQRKMWDGNAVVGRFKEVEERQNLMMLYYNLRSKI